jgi:hypothetical protein
MPKMSEHEPYLKPYMVIEGDRIQILDEGEFVSPEDTGFRLPVFQVTIKIPDGSTKQWSMNKTTRNRCASIWGDDSKDWIGHWLRIDKSKQMVQGTRRDVLFGTPSDAPNVHVQQNIEHH